MTVECRILAEPAPTTSLLATGGHYAELWQSWTHVRAAHHGVVRLSE